MPERVKLVVLMAAMVIYLIAQAPGHARAAQLDPSIPFDARMSGSLLAVMFMAPLLAFAVASILALVSRLTPWRLSAESSRLALFWALLAASPAVLLTGLAAGLIGQGPALTVLRVITGLSFLIFWVMGMSVLVRKA